MGEPVKLENQYGHTWSLIYHNLLAQRAGETLILKTPLKLSGLEMAENLALFAHITYFAQIVVAVIGKGTSQIQLSLIVRQQILETLEI